MALLLSVITALLAFNFVRIEATPTGVSPGIQTPLSSTAWCRCEVNSVESKPKDWIKSFNDLTDQFLELAGPTKDLTTKNAFLVVAGEGPLPIILQKVAKAVESAEGTLKELAGAKPLKDGKDSDDVFEAYVATTKAALFWANILSSKSNGFRGDAIFVPIGAIGESALLGVLGIFQGIGFAVTDYLEDRVGDVQEQSSALYRGLDAAIIHYQLIRNNNF